MQFNDTAEAVSVETLEIMQKPMRNQAVLTICRRLSPPATADETGRARYARVPGKTSESTLGLHLEGPWLNLVKKGTHNRILCVSLMPRWSISCVRTPTDYQSDPGTGNGSCGSHQQTANAGIVVSAGHSNATLKEAKPVSARGLPLPPICTTRCRIFRS